MATLKETNGMWGSRGRSALVPALPWDLVLLLLGSLTAALQRQDTALARQAGAGRVGRCHGCFPQCGILSFLPCCHQGPKLWAMGSISARLLQNCMLGHPEDAGAPPPCSPRSPGSHAALCSSSLLSSCI